MDIEVTPYYTIENVKYKYNAGDRQAGVHLSIRQVVTDPAEARA